MNNRKVNNNNNNLLKSVGIIILGLIVLSLFFDLFFGSSIGASGMDAMHGGQQPSGYYGAGSLIANILLLIIKILSILLAVGLIAGTWILIRDFVLVDNGTSLLSAFSNSLGFQSTKCPKCGGSVKSQWDYCPDCGNDLSNMVQQSKAENT